MTSIWKDTNAGLTCLIPCFSGNTDLIPRILSTRDRYQPLCKNTRKLTRVAIFTPVSNQLINLFICKKKKKLQIKKFFLSIFRV